MDGCIHFIQSLLTEVPIALANGLAASARQTDIARADWSRVWQAFLVAERERSV